ncbi:hypothetical protein TSOC_004537 [Tetrabaena socialis]|uniref:RING-CH-type domain-containing protein n=1 Tax=Tetrabaena socialis TaxID=47790 RepID=A0A2J8A8R7_9CHLO|nr:hypothetical protein TSOC_004537 [Tetrabaena socialis]|eukprot:PNH08895.1 hypothetical protein TSOC_004537 [Tetrabaena socialis]
MAFAAGGDEELSEEACWLCLGGEDAELGPLGSPCKCPRVCHSGCLSRWQLHSAGKREEKLCRFCGADLPDWRAVPPSGCGASGAAASAAAPAAADAPPAYMRISYNGRSHKIRVRPGPDGTRQFIEDCRKLLRIPAHLDFDVVFHCKEPATQSDLRFRGLDAFDAAVRQAPHAPDTSATSPAAVFLSPETSPPATRHPTVRRYCASLANQFATQQPQPQQQVSFAPLPAPRPLVRATSEVEELAAREAARLAGGGGDGDGDGEGEGIAAASDDGGEADQRTEAPGEALDGEGGGGGGGGRARHGTMGSRRRTAAAAREEYTSASSAFSSSASSFGDEADDGSGGGGGTGGGGVGLDSTTAGSIARSVAGALLGAFRRCGS